MNSRELKAAAMRDVYLGFTASADLTWDELPQHHRDRWLAALDAAQPEVPQGVPSVEELAKLICQTECSTNKILRKQEVEDLDLIVAAAIRDRVLAGVQAAPPPLSDEIIERMAKAHMGVISPSANWEHTDKQYYMNAIRAALAAVGPQYCPADVAFSSRVPEPEKKIDNQRMNLRQLHDLRDRERAERNIMERELAEVKAENTRLKGQYGLDYAISITAERDALRAELAVLHEGETVEGVIMERDHYRVRLDLAEKELAELRDQIDDDNTNAAAVNDLLIRVQNVTAERDRIVDENKQVTIDYGIAVKSRNWQQEAHVACKNEMDRLVSQLAAVTAERDDARVELAASEIELADKAFYVREFAAVSEERDAARAELAAMKAQLDETERQLQAEKKERFAAEDELAALKSQPGWELDVTVEELAPIYWAGRSTQFGIRDFKDLYEDDRVLVLSGLSTVLDLCRSRIRPATPSTYTDADVDVEALARVLQSTWTKSRGLKSRWEDYDDLYQDGYLAEARAAIAHLGQRWTGPTPERPEGLPTAEELARISDAAYCEVHEIGGHWDKRCPEHRQGEIRAAEAILAALAPWLREPVGWELDVTWQDLYNTYQTKLCGLQGSWEAVLDLCRSRIRPAAPRAYTDADVEKLARVMRETHAKTCGKVPDAYELDGFRNDARAAMDWMGATVGECKECEKNKSERDVMYRDWDDCRNRMLKMRLALNEGDES